MILHIRNLGVHAFWVRLRKSNCLCTNSSCSLTLGCSNYVSLQGNLKSEATHRLTDDTGHFALCRYHDSTNAWNSNECLKQYQCVMKHYHESLKHIMNSDIKSWNMSWNFSFLSLVHTDFLNLCLLEPRGTVICWHAIFLTLGLGSELDRNRSGGPFASGRCAIFCQMFGI